MEIRKCYEILDVEQGASRDDVRRAYRDIASVWHPDRFNGNPRLKEKAEVKLKEINRAYETLENHFSSGPERPDTDEERPKAGPEAGARDMTEAVFEVGTEVVLTVFSRLYSSLRRLVSEQTSSRNEAADYPRDERIEGRGPGRGRGGRGRGRAKPAGRGGRRR